MVEPTVTPARPLITVVSACYGVEAFLPAFIASIDAQDFDPDRLEVVMVDDGSVDGTPALLAQWAARRPDVVRVVTQANAGQGAARNAGIDAATGTWITFPDPDDVLDPDYLSRAAAAIEAHQDVDLVATSRWLMNDSTGESTNTHPLRSQFTRDAVYRLSVNDSYFHGGAVASFMRLDRINEHALRFDGRIRPNFEDGHFCAAYLLLQADPRVAFCSARYHYRKRADGTSTLQNALSNPGRYTTVLRRGYLDILTKAKQAHGRVPLWLQNFIIYELNYYVGREDAEVGTLAPTEVRDEFHALLGEITALLAPATIRGYRRTHLRPTTRALLQHGWRGEDWRQTAAVAKDHDRKQGLALLVYRYTGKAPAERVLLGEREVTPVGAKTRDVRIQGRVVMHERFVWVPAKRVRLELDGEIVEIVNGEARSTQLAVRPQNLPVRGVLPPVVEPELDLTRAERRTSRRAASRRVQAKFADAWVLMDRVHNADDSAEHLFRHLRTHSAKTNAWFVVEKDTPCWRRLERDHADRLVAHGSEQWKQLLLNAAVLISSHADQAVVRPAAMASFGTPGYRFVFLQHGVIKDDLSGWLNHRPLDLFVTSTQGEYDSIVADHTSYLYTAKETVLTGLPRFDALTRAGRSFAPESRDLVLISPTWRDNLVPPLDAGSQRRASYDWITETPYWKNWAGLMFSEDLKKLCEEQGLELALLPHPNMEATLSGMDLPAHVRRYSFDGDVDVRELFARAAVLVTDYSSTAFNSAYIDRPVVYFQFDQVPGDESRHVGLPGYFDYVRDGFGPVTWTVAEAEAEVRATVEHGRSPRSPWRERIDATFPTRDDENCARVTAEIKRMMRPRKVRYTD